MSVQYLLGPQFPKANVNAVCEAAATQGPVVSITAGWRDSEGDPELLSSLFEGPSQDLGLYQRTEEIFRTETALTAIHRERQIKLQDLQRLYQVRLNASMQAARKLMNETGQPDLLKLEQRAAITQVRALDRHHIRRIAAIHREFDERRAEILTTVALTQRNEVHQLLSGAGLVLIAGGHVAILLNRIRLFGLQDLLAQKTIVAWSAGAMVLGERIVLFHDNAPQGKRNAEVLDAGLGIIRRLIPLPHAKSRLDWSSRTRMALFSRRFAPAYCCTLDSGSVIRIDDSRISEARESSVITRTGRKKKLVAR